MDQPYTGTVRTLLAFQHFGANEPTPYDDTGWTLDLLRHVLVYPIGDSAVLTRPMEPLTADAARMAERRRRWIDDRRIGIRPGLTLVVRHSGDWRAAVLPWKVLGRPRRRRRHRVQSQRPGLPDAARSSSSKARRTIATPLAALGLTGIATTQAIAVRRHPIALPRIAIMHSWLETQNEGWVRFAFDQMGIPYTYIADQTSEQARCIGRFNVVVFPHVNGSLTTLLNGRPMVGTADPWKKDGTLTPNLGVWDTTSDSDPAWDSPALPPYSSSSSVVGS